MVAPARMKPNKRLRFRVRLAEIRGVGTGDGVDVGGCGEDGGGKGLGRDCDVQADGDVYSLFADAGGGAFLGESEEDILDWKR